LKKNSESILKPQSAPSGTFAESLTSLHSRDIAKKFVSKKKKDSVFSAVFRAVAMLLCITVAFYCMVKIVSSLIDYYKTDELYDSIIDIWNEQRGDGYIPYLNYAIKDGSPKDVNGYSPTEREPEPTPPSWDNTDTDKSVFLSLLQGKMASLLQQNPDTYCWINVPGTQIDYPVVKGDDNDYYLNHSFTGIYLSSGTIFADYRLNDELLDNYNVVLFGHNMNSGAMFNNVSKFMNRQFFEENKYIYIYTANGMYIYEVYSIFKTNSYYNYAQIWFNSGDDFVEFANRIKGKSRFRRDDVTIGPSDKILTLSTCTNSVTADGRYCLQAKLVDIKR